MSQKNIIKKKTSEEIIKWKKIVKKWDKIVAIWKEIGEWKIKNTTQKYFFSLEKSEQEFLEKNLCNSCSDMPRIKLGWFFKSFKENRQLRQMK